MLVDFSVCNFGPFRDKTTLSMQATAYDEHPENRIGSDRIEDDILTCAAELHSLSYFKSVDAD